MNATLLFFKINSRVVPGIFASAVLTDVTKKPKNQNQNQKKLAKGGISPYMSVTWQSPVWIGLNWTQNQNQNGMQQYNWLNQNQNLMEQFNRLFLLFSSSLQWQLPFWTNKRRRAMFKMKWRILRLISSKIVSIYLLFFW